MPSNASHKLLHITTHMSIGGAEGAIFQLIRGQRSAGVEADLLVSSSISYYGKKVAETGARVFELGQRNGFDISERASFLKIIKGYDILHFQTPAPALMYLASREGGRKLYYTHRGGVFKYAFKRTLTYKASGFIIRNWFDGVSGNTKKGALAASQLFNISLAKISVTYNGIDFSLLKPKRKKKEVLSELGDLKDSVIRIGTSANIRDWKRIDYLLKSVAELADMGIHCYVFGEGPARQNLENQCGDLGICDLVSFTGMKKGIGDYLQVLDIFVLPSNNLESFGNSAVEAIGLSIPTIVMEDGGGLVEHITKGGGFIAKNPGEITLLLRKLCRSGELRCSVGETGKRYVREKYSVDKMVKVYDDLYSSSWK